MLTHTVIFPWDLGSQFQWNYIKTSFTLIRGVTSFPEQPGPKERGRREQERRRERERERERAKLIEKGGEIEERKERKGGKSDGQREKFFLVGTFTEET